MHCGCSSGVLWVQLALASQDTPLQPKSEVKGKKKEENKTTSRISTEIAFVPGLINIDYNPLH